MKCDVCHGKGYYKPTFGDDKYCEYCLGTGLLNEEGEPNIKISPTGFAINTGLSREVSGFLDYYMVQEVDVLKDETIIKLKTATGDFVFITPRDIEMIYDNLKKRS